MVRAGYLIFATLLSIGPAFAEEADNAPEAPLPAAQLETRLAVKDAQYAERLVAAAVPAGDIGELKARSLKLTAVYSRVPEAEDARYKFYCRAAISWLSLLASDLADRSNATKIVAAETDRKEYLLAMPQCEALLDLSPPASPNLR